MICPECKTSLKVEFRLRGVLSGYGGCGECRKVWRWLVELLPATVYPEDTLQVAGRYRIVKREKDDHPIFYMIYPNVSYNWLRVTEVP